MGAKEELTATAKAIAKETMAYPYKVWGFGESIALEALWQAADVCDEPIYREWVLHMLERWLARIPVIQETDHSAPGQVLVEAYELTRDGRYLELAENLARYMSSLPRHSSGARFHRPAHPEFRSYLYVDCMEVDGPFLCKLGQVTGDATYFDRAAEQLLGYCTLLQDPATGLFYHQYDGETGRVNGAFWGRGSGWAMMGMLKTLRQLPVNHPQYEPIQQRFVVLARAIAAYQLPSGEWPTVIDKADTYCEASLPAFFCYAFKEATQEELITRAYERVADEAWAVLQNRVTRDGLLPGVSIATPPGNTDHYNKIPTGAGYPWGQAPLLLAYLSRVRSQNELG